MPGRLPKYAARSAFFVILGPACGWAATGNPPCVGAACGPSTCRPADPACEPPPRIRGVRFEGAGAVQLGSLRARTGFIIDQPATEENLVRLVALLGEDAALGGVSLRVVRPDQERGTAEVVVSADGLVRRVKSLALTTAAQGPADPDENWRLVRQVRAEERALLLAEGRPLHPYFQRLDEEMVRRAWLRRGYRDVVVRSEVEPVGALVEVVFRVTEGPRYTVHSVVIDGPRVENDEEREVLLERLSTHADDETALVPWQLTEDAERVRRHYCQRGYAEAQVEVRQALASRTSVDVGFQVLPGGLSVVGAVVVEGDGLSANGRASLALGEGQPYCGDRLAETHEAALKWMRDHGHPDAVVEVQATPIATAPMGPRRVKITVRVVAATEVKVARIWFAGNRNTREDVLRQMLVVSEGGLYRERELQTSVQNLLRTGLFREADVQTMSGAHRSERYLIFNVVEQDPVSVDLLNQSLTLRNLDLTTWPGDFQEVAAGAAFRGAGHELRFVGRSDEIGVRFKNLFLHRYLLTEGELAWRSRAVGAEEEQWLALSWGLGLKVLENRLALIPFLQVEFTDLEKQTVFDPLPIAQGSHVSVATGAVGRVDVNVRDDERIPYLGVDASLRYARAVTALGSDLDWQAFDAYAALNLPLGTNFAGAHYVLHLAGRYGQLWTQDNVTAHQRLVPIIRGYESTALGIPFEGTGKNDGGRIGGDRVASGTAELRIPVRPLRRNAIAPFVDAASVAAADEALFDRLHLAAGAAYYFSFFSERLEGFVYGAAPLQGDAAWRLFGAGVGGNF